MFIFFGKANFVPQRSKPKRNSGAILTLRFMLRIKQDLRAQFQGLVITSRIKISVFLIKKIVKSRFATATNPLSVGLLIKRNQVILKLRRLCLTNSSHEIKLLTKTAQINKLWLLKLVYLSGVGQQLTNFLFGLGKTSLEVVGSFYKSIL